jgi:tetratricopeptide (TPR) repeat protein
MPSFLHSSRQVWITVIVISLALGSGGCIPNRSQSTTSTPRAQPSPAPKTPVKTSVKTPPQPSAKTPAKTLKKPTRSPQTARKSPQTAIEFNDRGVGKINQQDYKGAIQDFDQALKLNAKMAETYLNRGIAYSSLNNSTAALADYSQAIQLNRTLGSAYLNRADEYIILNQNPKAIADLRQAIHFFKKQGNPAQVQVAEVALGNLIRIETQSAEMALAVHLKSVGAKMYGAYWCPACQWQEDQFKEAITQVEVIECDPRGENAQPDRCEAANIQALPTWQIKGQVYPSGTMTLEDLANLSDYQGPRNFR